MTLITIASILEVTKPGYDLIALLSEAVKKRAMPVFAALGILTEQGLRNLDAMNIRHKRAVEHAEEHGAKIMASYALVGQYDFLVLLEAPDAKTAVRVLSKEAEHGNVHYQTMEAIPMAEFTEFIQK